MEDGLRPTRPANQPLAQHPAAPHAGVRTLLRLDEPSLSLGSWHELCGGDWAQGGGDGDGRCRWQVASGKWKATCHLLPATCHFLFGCGILFHKNAGVAKW